MDAAAIVREARKRAGLTQAELAERVDMRQEHLCRLESSGRDPSLRVLRRILDACGCELRYRVVRAHRLPNGERFE